MLRYTDYDIVFREIPDETTLAVNLAGCPNRCPGCHSPQLQEPIGEPLTEEIVERLLARYGAAVTCFCLMGVPPRAGRPGGPPSPAGCGPPCARGGTPDVRRCPKGSIRREFSTT